MPANSKTGRCVRHVEGTGKSKVSAIRICQAKLGTSYKTGRKAKGRSKK